MDRRGEVGGRHRARDNDVTEEELVEAITHLAFYVGWPRAMAAITSVRKAFSPES